MAEGRERSEWNRTGVICALQAEINRDRRKRSRPFKPDDFMPFNERPARKGLSWEAMEKLLTDKRRKIRKS